MLAKPTWGRGAFVAGAAAGPLLTLAAGAVILGLILWPWLRPDLEFERLPDGPNHLLRIYVVDAALRRGDPFPRWLSDLYLGYGYPLLNFYAPAMYFLAATLRQLGLSVYASLQWTAALGVATGVGGAYALAHALYGGRRDAALLATAAFSLAPYPFFATLYSRGAIPELLAIALLPWALWAAWGMWRHR
ncbi:MAG TPA: hypothetical protein VHS99_10660, partial [Chloroflexota bacterium]|nr:hypothetical protein [Chloroflexota bacterium]